MRPIDADALISNIKSEFEGAAGLMASSGALFAVMALKSAPTLTLDDLRPKGRWLHLENGVAYCSECEMDAVEDGTNFCPECGADMRKEGAFCDTGRN